MKTSDCIRWLWDTSVGFRLRIALSAALGGLHVCVSLLFIWISKRLVDTATEHSERGLTVFIAWLVVCMVALLLLSIANSRVDSLNTIRLKNRLRHRLFAQMMESCCTGREKFHTGDVLNRMEEDVRTVTDTLCKTGPSILVTGIQLVTSFSFLLMLDARLGWILPVIMPVALLASKGYSRKMRKLTGEIRSTDSSIQVHVQEHLQYRVLMRTLEQTPRSISMLAGLQTRLHNQVMCRTDYSLFSRMAVQAGFAAGYATAFLWGVFGLCGGTVSFGMMTAFLQLVGQVQRPVVELGHQVPILTHAATAVERLSELSALPAEQQGVPVRLPGNIGLRLEQVDFTYPDGGPQVISHFSHDFRPGTLTALVGETGVGKSTLIKLMLALLIPDKGTITMYDAYRTVDVSPLTRCNVVYVPQGNTLMPGTVRDNLFMGNPDATDEQLCDALHTAAAEFVFELPDGLNTCCGEQGAGLSQGQAQRIAIARGLLRPGNILLMDEPTSSLDSETEQLLLKRWADGVRGKTLILVTHRESVAQFCMKTIKIEKL